MNGSLSDGWYAIRVPPRHIKLNTDAQSRNTYFPAERMLSRLGVEVFLPTMQLWRWRNRYAKEKTLITYPLMAPYVFVNMQNGYDWEPLLKLNYIDGVVGIGDKPFVIDEKDVNELKTLHDDGQWRAPEQHRHMRTHGEFLAGDEVFVESGPYEGHRVIVRQIRKRLADVTLTIFGAERTVVIPLDNLLKPK